MATYALQCSFDIDHGELDGLSPQECFVLGYELSTIHRLLTTSERVFRVVHAKNRERIEKACRLAGAEFRLSWLESDSSETWMQLSIS